MFCELMGICFSCRRPGNNRLNNKISEHISASVTPLHVCLEESRGPELGSCDTTALRSQQLDRHQSFSRQRKQEEIPSEEDISKELFKSSESDIKQIQSMANTISNMKMTNPIKGLVSKRRKRFTADGFDLDLTYIKDNLIAMGFPAERLEGVYRNHIDDVVRFLESKHKDHYKIYNLCSERTYDCKKFKQRVATYPFDDHNPPSMYLIKPFCEDVHKWLTEKEGNVAVVHCKAGKGRTGVMVSCYLLHSKQCRTAAEALNFYGAERTTDKKGVTIPSQRRYVNYYATLVQENLNYQPITLILQEIKLDPIPTINGGQGYQFVISEEKNKIFTSEPYEIRKGTSSLCISLPQNIAIRGDIRIDFYYLPKVKRKEKLFHFWFNTFFVRDLLLESNHQEPIERTTRALSCDGTAMELPMVPAKPRAGSLANLNPILPALILTIDKWNLDGAHKDKHHKIYSPDFKVSLIMRRVKGTVVPSTETRTEEIGRGGGQESPSESSEADSSECDTTGDEDGWESGEFSSLVKSQSHTHGSSRNTHRASLGEASEESLSRRDDKRGSSRKLDSAVSTRRSSELIRTSTLNT